MESQLPKRKTIRLPDYDYSLPGAYFITVCTKDRKALFWANVGADIIRPNDINLSLIGEIVDSAIKNIHVFYPHIDIVKYCIMPDHIHMLVEINADIDGRIISAPTLNFPLVRYKFAPQTINSALCILHSALYTPCLLTDMYIFCLSF